MLPLLCEREDSNAKTKGYSATLLLLMRLAVELGLVHGSIAQKQADAINSEFAGRRITAALIINYIAKNNCIKALENNYLIAFYRNIWIIIKSNLGKANLF